MESNREKATKALLSKFTYYSSSEIIDIIRLLDLAGEVDPMTNSGTEVSWNEESAHRIFSLFKSFFSYKNLSTAGGDLSVDFEPENQSTDLLFYLALLEHNIASQIRNLSNDVFASSHIRAKAKIPLIHSFKGYVLNRYDCKGDYARYFDYLFFGFGQLKENPGKEAMIFFRATRNQVKDYFKITRTPEIGSYLGFTNHRGEVLVTEEAFV